MSGGGLTKIELALSMFVPLLVLGVAAGLGGWAALALLVGALAGLGIAAAWMGQDSRDGGDWRPSPRP